MCGSFTDAFAKSLELLTPAFEGLTSYAGKSRCRLCCHRANVRHAVLMEEEWRVSIQRVHSQVPRLVDHLPVARKKKMLIGCYRFL